MGAIFNVEYVNNSGETIRDYIILRPNTVVDSNGTPGPTTINRNPAPSGGNRTFTPSTNVATLIRVHGTKGLIANCPKLFTLDASATGLNPMDNWIPRSGINRLKIISADFTIQLLDDKGAQYLEDVNSGKITAYMRQEELVSKHGYEFTATINFPKWPN